jgi:hypothetical protein
MRNLLILFIVLGIAAAGSFAQQLSFDKVPRGVRQSFQRRFQDVTTVEWKLKSDQNFEAEFKLRGVEIAAKFDSTGKWIETESSIRKGELPEPIRKAIAKDFKSYQIIETQTIERFDDDQKTFEIHLADHKQILKVHFDRKGKLLTKSATPAPSGR